MGFEKRTKVWVDKKGRKCENKKDRTGKLVPALPWLILGDRVLQYTIKHSNKARSLRITVDAADGVQVTVPAGFNAGHVGRIMRDKGAWVLEKLDYLSVLAGCPVPRRFVDGEQFFFLGNRFTFKININEQVQARAVQVDERQKQIIVNMPLAKGLARDAGAIRDVMVKWYKEQAGQIINERIELYAGNIGVKPAKIRIKEQKLRWGSCSGKGNVNFNWRLVMAPLNIIDYVIVHELCHLKRLDHSPTFWNLVEAVLPDYRNRRLWLKKYGPVLTF